MVFWLHRLYLHHKMWNWVLFVRKNFWFSIKIRNENCNCNVDAWPKKYTLRLYRKKKAKKSASYFKYNRKKYKICASTVDNDHLVMKKHFDLNEMKNKSWTRWKTKKKKRFSTNQIAETVAVNLTIVFLIFIMIYR